MMRRPSLDQSIQFASAASEVRTVWAPVATSTSQMLRVPRLLSLRTATPTRSAGGRQLDVPVVRQVADDTKLLAGAIEPGELRANEAWRDLKRANVGNHDGDDGYGRPQSARNAQQSAERRTLHR